ncbi:hypothetical protein M3Y98_00041700 [Aphelenchoides besseyi]|nr:hypothetical protein M3Y98_00041700 [Aphelenchoides besseyi]KAI6199032.1 hypothetical protein M3Y96_00583600 [Aphelenchoides besseyi]
MKTSWLGDFVEDMMNEDHVLWSSLIWIVCFQLLLVVLLYMRLFRFEFVGCSFDCRVVRAIARLLWCAFSFVIGCLVAFTFYQLDFTNEDSGLQLESFEGKRFCTQRNFCVTLLFAILFFVLTVLVDKEQTKVASKIHVPKTKTEGSNFKSSVVDRLDQIVEGLESSKNTTHQLNALIEQTTEQMAETTSLLLNLSRLIEAQITIPLSYSNTYIKTDQSEDELESWST